MKRFIKNFLVVLVFLSTVTTTNSVFAGQISFITSPEYYSEAIITNEGMSDDYNYVIDNVVNFDTKSSDVLIMINGRLTELRGILKNGTTYVPIEAVNYLNVKSSYDGKGNLTLNDVEFDFGDKKPFILDGVAYVPIRAIAESLDNEVGFVSKENDVAKMDNSIVWVDSSFEMNNAGYSVDEVKTWLKEQLYVNENFFVEIGNDEAFTKESVENMEYVGQVGRYALFDSTKPILVDMQNKKVYFYNVGNGYSSIVKMIDDGAYIIPQMENMIVKMPKELEGKYVIGAYNNDLSDDRGGAEFNVYEKSSYDVKTPIDDVDGYRYGKLFYVKQWNKEYSENNRPILAGASYDLYRTKNYNYMLHYPSDFQGYEADETIKNNYNETTNYLYENEDFMKTTFTPNDEFILDDTIDEKTKEAFYGEWKIKELAGLFTYMKDDEEYKNMDSVIGKTFTINDEVFSNDDLGKYQYGETLTKNPEYFIDGKYEDAIKFYDMWKLNIDTVDSLDVENITTINGPTMNFVLVNNDKLFVIFPDQSACFELEKVK